MAATAAVPPSPSRPDANRSRLGRVASPPARSGSRQRPGGTRRADVDGVRAGNWRILVGKDAEFLDKSVRAAPEDAYSQGFFDALVKQAQWRI